MPYISERRRNKIMLDADTPYNAGELNFLITMAAMEYVNNKGLSYKAINDVLGALEGAKLEFYRRVAVPYENGKLAENGDVYSENDPSD